MNPVRLLSAGVNLEGTQIIVVYQDGQAHTYTREAGHHVDVMAFMRVLWMAL